MAYAQFTRREDLRDLIECLNSQSTMLYHRRLLCVHSSIADGVIEMLQGAARELVVGDTADIATDVGPVIDAEAFDNIYRHIQRLKIEAKVLLAPVERAQAATKTVANLIAPHAFEAARITCIASAPSRPSR